MVKAFVCEITIGLRELLLINIFEYFGMLPLDLLFICMDFMKVIEYLKTTDSLFSQLAVTLGVVLLYLILSRIASNIIRRFGKKHSISIARVIYTIKYFRFLLLMLFLLILGVIWDLSFEGLSVYFLSFFTVAGVGLFANWSILSNVTSAIILFFYFPYRIGNRVRVIDGDNSIEGTVVDLNMFSIVLKNDEGYRVTYPNNLAIQKAIVMIKS